MRIWLVLAFISVSAVSWAQYKANPMNNKIWQHYGIGVNTADNLSWNTLFTQTKQNDDISTTLKFAYSQEWIEGKDDSIFFRKNRTIEGGIMWGQAWATGHLYVHACAGMGLTLRLYGDHKVQSNTEYVYKAGLTIGVPAQLEVGYLQKDYGITLLMTGNWNFRQPYMGAAICYTRRMGRTREE